MRIVKILVGLLVLWVGISNCGKSRPIDANTMPLPFENERLATFAGGCFWSVEEALSELEGVNEVISGYSGGFFVNPSFEMVGTGKTGHAESVQVYYDPSLIQFSTLAKAFFYAHNPTELNRQGPDIGTQYRSIAFYRTEAEKSTLDSLISDFTKSAIYKENILTEVKEFEVIYPAESHHQEYYKLNPDASYSVKISLPKIKKMRKEMYSYLKKEYQ